MGAPVTAEMVAKQRGGGKDFGSEASEGTPNGERPIAEEPARGKARRRGARGIRVKGFASRGEYTESRIEYEYEHEHEEGGEEDAGDMPALQSITPIRERQAARPPYNSLTDSESALSEVCFFFALRPDPAASLPNFFNNRCKVSRSFFERTRMAFSIAVACARKARMISARPFPVSST